MFDFSKSQAESNGYQALFDTYDYGINGIISQSIKITDELNFGPGMILNYCASILTKPLQGGILLSIEGKLTWEIIYNDSGAQLSLSIFSMEG